MDARFNREVKTWRDFFEGFRTTREVSRWVLRELTTKEVRKWWKKMIVWLILATIFGVLQPYILSMVFDGLVARNVQLIYIGVIAMFFALVINKLSDHKQSVAREWIMGLSWGELDDKITRLFFEKSVGQHLQESGSLSISNIDKGRWKVLELEALLLFEGISVTLALLFAFIALWFINLFAGAVMTIILFIHLFWMLYLNKKVLEECVPIDKEMRKLNRHRLARWENIERVKSNGKEIKEQNFMKNWFNKVISKDRGFWLWFIRHSSARGTVNIIGIMLIMVYGIYLVWNGSWTVGLLYPLMSWTNRLSENIWRIGRLEHQINWNIPAVKSMIDALSLEPDIKQVKNAVKISSADKIKIEFKNVSYRYPLSREEVEEGDKSYIHTLRNVSFTINPGEKVALIGPSGAGKTTVMRLLLRFMDPLSGQILVNGYDLKNIDLSDWVKIIGYIPQQAQILDGTIAYNLTYGLSDNTLIAEPDIWAVMKRLKIDFGLRLNKGLETLVGRDGIRLSGGQQQRLMIGAAAIKNPKLMVIDEATSNLDSTTEKEVQAGLAEVLTEDVSALVIAHRLSTVRNICNKFIVLVNITDIAKSDSQIEAIAESFEELYKKSPIFRQLAKDQDLVI